MRIGVARFFGTNCEWDVLHVLSKVLGVEANLLTEFESEISDYDAVVIPGGFSYGDYLRTGAMAANMGLMTGIKKLVDHGKLCLGICNGQQILLEAGLLPGAMLPNLTTRFICRFANIRVENNKTPFTSLYDKEEVLRIPIAHYEGRYYADKGALKRLKKKKQIVFRYCNENGEVTEESNPNGSIENIAGICSENKNIMSLMPHPERCSESILGSTDGRRVFQSMIKHIKEGR